MENPSQLGTFSPRTKRVALLLGPVLSLVLYFILPDSYIDASGKEAVFSHAGKACLSMLLWMALWWFTECVPIAVTAMLPLVSYPLLGVATAAKTMQPYASGTIFLFLGGFLLAAGIQRWGLDRRIALMTLKYVGTSFRAIVFGMLCSTAFISMWVSNSATAAMMVPIAVAVMGLVRVSQQNKPLSSEERNFGVAVLLAVAYGASIGGMATIIGSPPNGIYVRFVAQTYGETVSLLDWMLIGFPVTMLLLPLCWYMLTGVLFKKSIKEVPGGREWIQSELQKLGKLSLGEKAVLIVFVCTVLLWVFGGLIRSIEINGAFPLKGLTDEVISMAGGLSLFTIPVDKKKGIHALDWKDCDSIPWDVLLLFGGGLSMAAAIQSTGGAQLIAAQATVAAGLPEIVIVTAVCTLVVFATEFTSNTALAATMLPLLAAAAPTLGVNSETILLVTALGASAAFMMPVATPPNAIVFGTGRMQIMDMVKAGFLLNIIAIVVITGVVMTVKTNWLALIQ